MDDESLTFRLLTYEDKIQEKDQLLTVNWEWESIEGENIGERWMIGIKYNPCFFVPMRRQIDPEPTAGGVNV